MTQKSSADEAKSDEIWTRTKQNWTKTDADEAKLWKSDENWLFEDCYRIFSNGGKIGQIAVVFAKIGRIGQFVQKSVVSVA